MNWQTWLPISIMIITMIFMSGLTGDIMPQDSIQYTCSGDLNECIKVNT